VPARAATHSYGDRAIERARRRESAAPVERSPSRPVSLRLSGTAPRPLPTASANSGLTEYPGTLALALSLQQRSCKMPIQHNLLRCNFRTYWSESDRLYLDRSILATNCFASSLLSRDGIQITAAGGSKPLNRPVDTLTVSATLDFCYDKVLKGCYGR
jgi:hypothetical protein